jgi:transposase
MIPTGVQIFLALEPIDLRWSFDRLSGAAQETIGYDARSGALFVFYGRRKDALKILFFDGSGMAIFYKRFDKGVARIPSDLPPGTKRVELDDATLEALLDGIELEEKPESKRRRTVH